MVGIIARVVRRFASTARVMIDVPATLKAREKYPLFTEMFVARFDSSLTMYRIFDENELQHILSTGRITGGQYAVKAEREHGASWGSNITKVITWGNGQRGGRLGNQLYLAKLDAMDFQFAHLGIDGVTVDPNGPAEQPLVMDVEKCSTGLGCSIVNVGVGDVDFFRVEPNSQVEKVSLTELKAELKDPPPVTPAEPEKPKDDKIRDPAWGLQPKDKVIVQKGSKGLGVGTRAPARVMDVWQRGGEREVMVKLFFPYPRKFSDGRWSRDDLVLYATHPNRLKDSEIALMNSKGDRILIRKR